jgi:hypothetical protein
VIDGFVSYSRRDREAVLPVVRAAEALDRSRGAVVVRVEAATVIPLSGRWRRR